MLIKLVYWLFIGIDNIWYSVAMLVLIDTYSISMGYMWPLCITPIIKGSKLSFTLWKQTGNSLSLDLRQLITVASKKEFKCVDINKMSIITCIIMKYKITISLSSNEWITNESTIWLIHQSIDWSINHSFNQSILISSIFSLHV